MPGDVYRLGNNRLMCGDCRSKDDIVVLMNGHYADMLLTDPPYNVNYEGGDDNKLKIQNDSMMPVAGLEILDNRYCRLATDRTDVASQLTTYSDFNYIAYGRWGYGIGSYKIYPKFNLSQVDKYNNVAISHHRERSVDEFYGVNETHQGARPYIQGSNETAKYINSFLKNSIAAKIHEYFNSPNVKFVAPEKVVSVCKCQNSDRYYYTVYRLFKDFSSLEDCLNEHAVCWLRFCK